MSQNRKKGASIATYVSDAEKKAFCEICNELAIPPSNMIRIFVMRVIKEGKIPFELSVKKKQEED